MSSTAIHAVTGAFGYYGKYIAGRLLQQGENVVTLTNSSSRASPFGSRIRAFPFHFDRPDLLVQHLEGHIGPLQHLLGAIRSLMPTRCRTRWPCSRLPRRRASSESCT